MKIGFAGASGVLGFSSSLTGRIQLQLTVKYPGSGLLGVHRPKINSNKPHVRKYAANPQNCQQKYWVCVATERILTNAEPGQGTSVAPFGKNRSMKRDNDDVRSLEHPLKTPSYASDNG